MGVSFTIFCQEGDHVVLRGGEGDDGFEFRVAIGQELPKYMIPVVFHYLPELQRNTNGKIDRLYYNKKMNQ